MMKIDEKILREFEKEIDALNGFGAARLEVVLHDNHPRFVLSTEKSIIPGKTSSGAKGDR